MATKRWDHFSHDADVGVRGIGSTPAEAFAEAALALCAVVTDPALVRPLQSVDIKCAAPDLETLLVDWLNRVVFEMATRKLIFATFEVRIEDGHLTAKASGEPIDVVRHEPAAEVKGATFTSLSVGQDNAGYWHAQCVLDV